MNLIKLIFKNKFIYFQLCFWAINTFALNLISAATRKERSRIIYSDKLKITRKEISELLKMIFERQ